MPEFPLLTKARQESEESWRLKLEKAYQHYQTTTTRYRRLAEKEHGGLIRGPNDPLALARRAQSDAVTEYVRVLKIFTELKVHGRMPRQKTSAEYTGGRL